MLLNKQTCRRTHSWIKVWVCEFWINWCRGQLKCDGTQAETRFCLSVKLTSPYKSAGCQFSRLLAAEACASVVVMLETPCSKVAWRVLATHSICQFPLPCITECHHIPTGVYKKDLEESVCITEVTTHLKGWPSDVFWTACRTFLYMRKLMVPVRRTRDRYATTLMREKYDSDSRIPNTLPKTIPDFLGSRQYTSSTTGTHTNYTIWQFFPNTVTAT